MMLTRLSPRFPSLFRDFDELFRDFAPPSAQEDAVQRLLPVADIAETAKAVELQLDLPGIKLEDLDVKVEGDLLTITATRAAEKAEEGKSWVRRERAWGQFVRSFTLPDTVDGSKPEASYKNGVLTVTLPKKEAALPKSIKVKVEA